VLERNVLVYRRIWKVFVSGFAEPVFYLLAIGIGVGALVGDITLPDGRLVSYTAFVAPALLGASAMNGAIYESTFNIFFKLKYGQDLRRHARHPAAAGRHRRRRDRLVAAAGGIYAVGFMVVMLAFGLVESWWAIMAIPAALLIGLAFGGGDGRDVLHAQLAGLRHGATGVAAAVPVLGDVLSARRLPRGDPA
jgi:lipooligosaccharide transport system permease protein